MNWELILTIVSSVITVAAAILGYYQYIKKRIEQEALNSINKAEETDKIGEEKMQDAIERVYGMIRAVAKPVISNEMVELVIQRVFDEVEEYARKQIEKKS